MYQLSFPFYDENIEQLSFSFNKVVKLPFSITEFVKMYGDSWLSRLYFSDYSNSVFHNYFRSVSDRMPESDDVYSMALVMKTNLTYGFNINRCLRN